MGVSPRIIASGDSLWEGLRAPGTEACGTGRWSTLPHCTSTLAKRVLAQDQLLLDAAQAIAHAVAREPLMEGGNGAQPRALIVGGFVRDSVLNLAPKDLDLEVYGVRLERLIEILEAVFPGKVDAVGRAFGVLKVFLGDGRDLDVSIPRRDSKQGSGHAGFVVHGDPTMSIAEAAERRDFSWNALAACPFAGTIIDSFGGLEDLRLGMLRVTSPRLFADDPLRVYRAAQFAARMELSVEPASFQLMREIVCRSEFLELSRERVTEELKKLLLKSPRPSVGFELLRSLGVTAAMFPELDRLVGTPQDPEWHPEGDVWTHTMMVVDAAAKIVRERDQHFSADERLAVLLAAVTHDFGKPATTEFVDGRIRSRGHEQAGVAPAAAFLGRLVIPQAVCSAVLAYTEHHMRPGELFRAFERKQVDDHHVARQIRKLQRVIGPFGLENFLTLTEADSRGRGLPGVTEVPYGPRQLIERLSASFDLEGQGREPLLRGRDLLTLGLTSGPQLGVILGEVELQRDRGALASREDALGYVRQRHLVRGADLQALGLEPGLRFKAVMLELRKAISEGAVGNRAEALAYVKQRIAASRESSADAASINSHETN